MTGQRVLVLGAGGFIGRSLAERLAMRGDSVIAAAHRQAQFAVDAIQVVSGRFDAPDEFTELLPDVDVVVHAASSSTPGSSSGQPVQELETNLRPTLALLTAMQEFPDRKLVYLSSGGTLYGDTQHADEEAPIRPRSYHGAAKASAEHFIHAWTQQYGSAATILRPSNVYGPGQPIKAGFGIIPAALDSVHSGRPIVVWGDGTAVRDYLYVGDLVALVERVLASASPKGANAYNVASGRETTINALLSCIEKVTGKVLKREYRTARAVDVRVIAPSPAKACDVFSWQPRTTLEQGLIRTWSSPPWKGDETDFVTC